GDGGHLYRRLLPGYDKLHVRFYVRFDPQCAPIHHFFHVGGYRPPTPFPQGGAGQRPRGDERFSVGIEPHGNSWVWDYYAYWMEMRGSPPRGQTWGNSFIRDPQLAVARGEWICVETMITLNDVGDSNGELALWIDGKRVSHVGKGFPGGKWVYDRFLPGDGGGGVRWNDTRGGPEQFTVAAGGEPFEGFRWRRDERLKINFLWVLFYMTRAPEGHVSQVWFDDIVVATDYIGPLARPEQPERQQPEPLEPAGKTVRIGAAQPRSRLIDYRLRAPADVLAAVDQSLDDLEQIVHKAGEAGCDALALPEDTLGLGHWEAGNPSALGDVLPAAVERMLERLGRAAASHRMYLVCSNDTIDAEGAVRNTAFLLGRDGREIGRYDKVNMPIHELEKTRGNSFPVFQTPDLGDVGMLICYDMVFPEAARCLALGGADVIFNPTLGGAAIGDADISRAAFRTRAVENFVYIVVSKRGSGSMIVSPQGRVLAEGQDADGIAIADIEPGGGRAGGDAFNSQQDMRARLFRERSPAAFGILTDPDPRVLTKVPATISIPDAGRIANAALTVGGEEFQRADLLLRDGRTDEAARAFEALIARYPATWIDRVARERLARLGRRDEPDQRP
ncbi:MAG TPA: nitrilase-related carbon-nitrogen hydrolase, partial [Planctomycetaceae bacterium]|nr:nitrilase-related carbon-nitrogen hydrolase [Planctomycetaceae bacterium]